MTYDLKTDTLSMILIEGVQVAESVENKPWVILDYDSKGNLVSVEALDASMRATEPRAI